jgi:hypothetical protein
LFVVFADDAEGFGDGLTDLFVSDGEGLLKLSLDDVFFEELGKGFGDFAFHKFTDGLESVGSAFELVEIFESESEMMVKSTFF